LSVWVVHNELQLLIPLRVGVVMNCLCALHAPSPDCQLYSSSKNSHHTDAHTTAESDVPRLRQKQEKEYTRVMTMSDQVDGKVKQRCLRQGIRSCFVTPSVRLVTKA